MIWFILIFAILTGTLMPFQAGINAHLAKHIHEPLQAAFISFLGGFLSITIICLVSRKYFPTPQKLAHVPPHLLIGGLLGVIFVVTTIILAPKLGATVLISCIITGQLAASIFLDHFGLLGFSVHPINAMRVVGVLFLFIGTLFVRAF